LDEAIDPAHQTSARVRLSWDPEATRSRRV